MPELPDIVILTNSMSDALVNRKIITVQVNQPKVLNQSVEAFRDTVINSAFLGFRQRGKWILASLTNDWILAFNLGMGGAIRLHTAHDEPNPRQERVIFTLDTNEQLWIRFWWFGHVHTISSSKLNQHPQLGTLGIEPLSDAFSLDVFTSMLQDRRGRIKNYLLNQRFIAGIGNVYVQDILWLAGIHPTRKANTLTINEIRRLHQAIKRGLHIGIANGPGPGEQDLWGTRGRWNKVPDFPYVAYRTGKACPTCSNPIEETRVGNTTSYICPHCQT